VNNELTSDLAPSSGSSMSLMMLDANSMRALVTFSEMMAKSAVTVPDHLKGKPADCMAIAMQAAQWGMNPFAVAQKTHVVSGRLGYEAQLVNAVIQNSGAIVGSFHYEYQGSGATVACRVGAVLRGESGITWGEWLAADTVTTKNSPLWKTNAKQQLGYLQVKNWARLYCPGAILGVYSEDELEEIPAARDMGNVDEVRGPRRKSETAAPAAQVIDNATGEIVQTAAAPAPEAATPAPKPAAAPAGGISGGQVAYLRNKLKSAGAEEQSICDRFQVTGIELLNAEQFDTVKAELLQMA
jgi:hypothetical protein